MTTTQRVHGARALSSLPSARVALCRPVSSTDTFRSACFAARTRQSHFPYVDPRTLLLGSALQLAPHRFRRRDGAEGARRSSENRSRLNRSSDELEERSCTSSCVKPEPRLSPRAAFALTRIVTTSQSFRITIALSPSPHPPRLPPPGALPQIKVASAADMVAISPTDVFVKLRVLVGVSAGIFAAMHLVAGATVAWDGAHHRTIVAEVKGAKLGFRAHASGAWTWSFAQEPLTADVGLLRGGAVDCARMLGCPFVRLRAALPEDLLAGGVAESLGRRAGMAPRELERAFEAERSLVRDLRSKSKARKAARGERARLQKLWGSTRKSAAGAAASVVAALSRKRREPPALGGRPRGSVSAAAAASLATAVAAVVRRSLPRRRTTVTPFAAHQPDTPADIPAETGVLGGAPIQPSGEVPSALATTARGPVSEVVMGGPWLGGRRPQPRLGGTRVAPAAAGSQRLQAPVTASFFSAPQVISIAAFASSLARPKRVAPAPADTGGACGQTAIALPASDATEVPPQLPPRPRRPRGLSACRGVSSPSRPGPVAESAEGSGRLNATRRPDESSADEPPAQWGQRRTSPQAWGSDMTGGMASHHHGAPAPSEEAGAAADAVRGFFDDEGSDDRESEDGTRGGGRRSGSRLAAARRSRGSLEEPTQGGVAGAARMSRVLNFRETARGAAWAETPPTSQQRPYSPMETEIRPFDAESSSDSSVEVDAAVHHYQSGRPQQPSNWAADELRAPSAAAADSLLGGAAMPQQAARPLLRVSSSSGDAALLAVRTSGRTAGSLLPQQSPRSSLLLHHGDAALPAESPRSPSVLPIKARRRLLDAGRVPLVASSSESEGDIPPQQELGAVAAIPADQPVIAQARSGEGAGSSGASSSSAAAGLPAVSRGGTAFTARWQPEPGSPLHLGISGAHQGGSPPQSLLQSSSSSALALTQRSSGAAGSDLLADAVTISGAAAPSAPGKPAAVITVHFQAASDEDDASAANGGGGGEGGGAPSPVDGISTVPPLRVAVALPAPPLAHLCRREDAPQGILVNHSPHPPEGEIEESPLADTAGGRDDTCEVGSPSDFKARRSRARSVVSKRRKVAQKTHSRKHKVGAAADPSDGDGSGRHGGQLRPRLSAWPHSPRSPREAEGGAGSPCARSSHRQSEASDGGRSARSSRRSAVSPYSAADTDDGLDSDELEDLEEDRAAAQELTSSALVFAFLKGSRVMPAVRSLFPHWTSQHCDAVSRVSAELQEARRGVRVNCPLLAAPAIRFPSAGRGAGAPACHCGAPAPLPVDGLRF